MSSSDHWDAVYSTRAPDTVSWYRPRLERSLAAVERCALPPGAHVVDVGGGASTFVDDLLARGFVRVSVVDLSARGLEHARARLGDDAARVRWIVGDATTPLFDEASVDFWHDRAVFHFLTEPTARRAYAAQVARSVRPGGFVSIATFGPDGPERCSGLPVMRHSAESIARELGVARSVVGPSDVGSRDVGSSERAFEWIDGTQEVHVTPAGARQSFTYALLRRSAS